MSTELPQLTVGEAVMRMDLADAPMLLFRNRSHGELNVVYRRGDGNIGWIDPINRGGRRQPAIINPRLPVTPGGVAAGRGRASGRQIEPDRWKSTICSHRAP